MDAADTQLQTTAGPSPARLPGGISDLSAPQAQELNRLGQLQEMYTPDTSSRILWICFLVFFLLFGLLVSAIPFLPPPQGVPPASPLVVLLIVAVVGLIVAACLWRLRRLARERRLRILVFADGLARFDGESLSTGRWEEIESVQGILYKAPKAFAIDIIIMIRGGKRIRARWLNDHVALGQALFRRVAEESSRHLLPRCFAALEAGQTIIFQAPDAAWLGGIASWSRVVLGISKSGLHWGTQILAWDNPEQIDFKDGLRIHPQGQTRLALVAPWVHLADIPIPNSLVFLRLAEHCLRENGRVVPGAHAT